MSSTKDVGVTVEELQLLFGINDTQNINKAAEKSDNPFFAPRSQRHRKKKNWFRRLFS